MRLAWLKNDFICKELYGPFVLEKDDIGKEFYEEHIRQTGEAHGRNQD